MALVLLLLFLSLSTSHPISAAKCHFDDETGLLGFKAAITADPSGLLSTWKPGTDCCTWHAVKCGINTRVTKLNFDVLNNKPKVLLSGTISPSLTKLRYLTALYLVNLKNITGGFPTEIFQALDLKTLFIINTQLSGHLPSDFGRYGNLDSLVLEENQFSGTIPKSISQFTELTLLVLTNNMLSGKIPGELRQLKKLASLLLQHNFLSGPIPDLSSITGLVNLNLGGNKFTGKIPTTLSTLAPQLKLLALYDNKFTGEIPDFLGNFTKLEYLNLSGNYLTGHVPPSFKNLTNMNVLDLSRNLLVDPFPDMYVKDYMILDLSHNKFHLGTIPKWMASSPSTISLKLASCGIKMRLEDFIPLNTSYFYSIDLSDNEISGSPIVLLNRTENLVNFQMSRNKLRFDMGSLTLPKSLESLDIAQNLAFGKIPESVSGLKELNVSYNRLCGEIPKTKFPASAFVGNACLCGAPLPPCKQN